MGGVDLETAELFFGFADPDGTFLRLFDANSSPTDLRDFIRRLLASDPVAAIHFTDGVGNGQAPYLLVSFP
jgi:hypothetical protein